MSDLTEEINLEVSRMPLDDQLIVRQLVRKLFKIIENNPKHALWALVIVAAESEEQLEELRIGSLRGRDS